MYNVTQISRSPFPFSPSPKKGRKRKKGVERMNDSIFASYSYYIEKEKATEKVVLVMWRGSERYHFGISEKILHHPRLIS